ncbi:MAG: alpha-2-macroglobulin family protein [Magnetospiraceae bacterium]
MRFGRGSFRNLFFLTVYIWTMVVAGFASAAEEPFSITGFTPQGDVRNVRQVHVRFSQPVVEFGDPRDRVAPLFTDCEQPAQSRWVDSRNWVYEFDRSLPGGLRCAFQVQPNLATPDGVPLTGNRVFRFTTGGATLDRVRPWEGNRYISEDQVFVLTLDAPPDLDSVERHAYFVVEGIASKVGLSVFRGEENRKITGSKDPHQIAVKSHQTFPPEAKVSLIWSRSILTANGMVTGMTEDRELKFRVRPAYTYTVRCRHGNGETKCDPLGDIHVWLSELTDAKKAAQFTLKSADGHIWEADPQDEFETRYVVFRPPFPPNTAFTLTAPDDLADTDGRTATQPKINNLATGDYPPLAKFPARFGILELMDSPVLPVTLRNLEPDLKVAGEVDHPVSGSVMPVTGDGTDRYRRIIDSMITLNTRRYDETASLLGQVAGNQPLTKLEMPLPKTHNQAEVVGIPLETPGFYLVEIASRDLSKYFLQYEGRPIQPEFLYTATGALVTNMAVHMKTGRENSLAWVTALNDGSPIESAKVSAVLPNGEVVWSGATGADGVAVIDADLAQYVDQWYGSKYQSGIYFFVEKEGDLSFAHSSWNDGIESWRYPGGYTRYDPNALIGHTVFDRELYRAGETVSMKHYLRRHLGSGMGFADQTKSWTKLVVEHQGTNQEYTFTLDWDRHGAAHSVWKIPESAKLGSYSVTLYGQYDSIYMGRFRVLDYKIPLTQGTIKGPEEPLVRVDALDLDLSVRYLAGGGASRLGVAIRSELTETRNYYSHPQHEDYYFDSGKPDADPEDPDRRVIDSVSLRLDEAGTARHSITDLPQTDRGLQVLTEMSYNDPNGEVRTVVYSKAILASPWHIGLKAKDWLNQSDKVEFTTALLDLSGKPVVNQPVKVELYKREYISHRKKLAGGVYEYEHETRTTPLGQFCAGETDSAGHFHCEGETEHNGSLFGVALATDPNGLEIATQRSFWIPGPNAGWGDVEATDRMDVLADKKEYEPGDTARFQLRMPFKQANALVTVEREGVLDYSLQPVTNDDPVVSVPIAENFAPNVQVAVLAVRGRVGDVQPTAMIDLGRPSFRFGMARVDVGWQGHRLNVQVSPDKEVYDIREVATVKIKVTTADGDPLPEGAEVALAAVDEGLLLLSPNRSWKLLEKMMGRRSSEVETATAQMQVVGKRHFGQKAVKDGGDGGGEGRGSVRELFDTLLLWQGKAVLNGDGEAVINVPLNDSITAFRIVAIASAGPEKFGTGETTIRATKDLMVFSGLAPLMREGDRLQVPFTLRNTTDTPMTVDLKLSVAGLTDQPGPQQATIPPGQSLVVAWPIQAPLGATTLSYLLEVSQNGTPVDALRVSHPVLEAVPARVLQGTLEQVAKPLEISVKIPDDAVAGKGGVRVELARSLVDAALGGVVDYMSRYPYTCFEQKTSIAISLDDSARWEALMGRLPAYLDNRGLVKYFPLMREGSVMLTSYVLATAHERGWKIPAAPRDRMLKALSDFVEGRYQWRSYFTEGYGRIIRLSALEALSRYGRATPGMLEAIDVWPRELPTSALLDWFNILRRLPDVENREAKLEESAQLLYSRIRFDGRMIRFTTSDRDNLWWFMTGGDVNASRVILSLLEFGLSTDDMPRFVEGALSRQINGHWRQTTANAWGALALRKFAAAFEKEAVTGATVASLDASSERHQWSKGDASYLLPWAEKGKAAPLMIEHQGGGAPWASILSVAAVPWKTPFDSGLSVRKTVTALSRKDPNVWSIGDEVRVKLEINNPADMTWVVLDDPIPPGAVIMGSGLGGESVMARRGESRQGRAYLAFVERAHDGLKAYYHWVPQGDFTYEYTYRINAAGDFSLPATRVEAMYKPELFGVTPNAPISVVE